MQSFVQFIHELRRRGVADFPQSRYNVVRPSAKKSPSQTNKPFPRVGFHSSPITRGNGYQVGVPWVLDDVARIKLVCTRSEEHTSELQSRFDLVCRLLLEKKKKIKNK